MEGMLGYGVLMGTGTAVKGEGVCQGIVLTLKNIEIMEEMVRITRWNASGVMEPHYEISSGRCISDSSRRSQVEHLLGFSEDFVEGYATTGRRNFGGTGLHQGNGDKGTPRDTHPRSKCTINSRRFSTLPLDYHREGDMIMPSHYFQEHPLSM